MSQVSNAADQVQDAGCKVTSGVKNTYHSWKDCITSLFKSGSKKAQEATEDLKQDFSQVKDNVQQKGSDVNKSIQQRQQQYSNQGQQAVSDVKQAATDAKKNLSPQSKSTFEENKGLIISVCVGVVVVAVAAKVAYNVYTSKDDEKKKPQ